MNFDINLIRKSYKKGFFHLLSSNFLIQIVAFASQFFVAWILSPEDIGRIKILQTFTIVGLIIAGLGFNTSTLKLCSEDRSKEEKVALYGLAVKYTIYASISVLIVLFLLNHFNLITKDKELGKYFSFYMLTIIPLTFNALFTSYLQALKQIKKISKIQAITKISSVILIIILTYVLFLNGFIIGTIAGLTFTSFYFLYEIKKGNKGIIENYDIKEGFKQHWQYAKFSFLANAVNNIGAYADVFLINFLISDRKEVGYYGFALTLILAFQLIDSTAQQYATPFLSELAKKKKEFLKAFNQYNKLLITISIGLIFIGIIGVEPIISFMFKSKFDDSMPYFKILIIAWFFKSIASSKGIAFLALGKININFYVALIATISTFIVSYFLIQKFGIIGAAYGAVFNKVIIYLMTTLLFKKETNNKFII